MTSATLKKVSAATAAEICHPIRFSEDIGDPPGEKATPREFLDLMVARKKFLAGIEFLAHALPKREAVWWGCLCGRRSHGRMPRDPTRCFQFRSSVLVACRTPPPSGSLVLPAA